jgi:DNA adenine methylase
MTKYIDYVGGKWSLASWILSHIPREGVHSYTEAFMGSAAVLLSNPSRFRMETINDASGDVVNLFRVQRDNGAELAERIRLTPWAADEFALCTQPTDDPIEAARRFYFRCWAAIRPFDTLPAFRRQTFISTGRNNSAPMTSAAKLFARVDHLPEITERLRGVAIENMDALEFLPRYDADTAVHYVDPPYLYSTRKANTRSAYPVEFAKREGDADVLAHIKLAEVLRGLEGYVLLSGYPSDLYEALYEAHGWQRVDREARVNGGKRMATESLWLSPRTVAANGRIAQRSLFA